MADQHSGGGQQHSGGSQQHSGGSQYSGGSQQHSESGQHQGSSSTGQYHCSKCNRSFSNAEEMRKHEQQHHSGEQQSRH